MRKLKLQVQLTVDGYIGDANGEMDGLTSNWDGALNAYVEALTASVDCILLGRKLAQDFIPHWAAVATNPDDPDFAAGQWLTSTPKVVFSKTLPQSEWDNTTLATGDLVAEITQLKAQAGQDLIAYGGAAFVSSLIKHRLVDEYHLLVDPIAFGTGLPIFQGLAAPLPLRLEKSTAFPCGIVALHYEPKLS